MLFVLLWACDGSGKGDSETTAPPINQDDSSAPACEGTPPVITAVNIMDGGSMITDEGTFPSLVVQADITDTTDQDLNSVDMDLWFDTTVDGMVDTSTAAISGEPQHIDGDLCNVASASFGLQLPVDGSLLEVQTTYEFAVVVYDGHSLPSEVAIASGTTPGAL